MQTGTTRTVKLEVAAKLLGIGKTNAYALARRGELPVPTIRLGKRIVIAISALEKLLGEKIEVPNGREEHTI